MRKLAWYVSAAAVTVAAVVWSFVGCSGGSSGSSSGKAFVTTTISDPATCQAPSGPFSHVYIAVTDVRANVSSTAADNDSSWVDLTPGLSSSPKQIDLLGIANNQCFLASLGSKQELQAGSYQQIRIILAPDSSASSVSGNACGSFANCVVLSDGSVHDLALSSEAQTGIKIPSGQIAGGAFTIAAGETKDLDIDFNTCVSIVQQGNGTYRLKPVLHAGEVTTTSTSINGTVANSLTKAPLSGTTVVALEQKDPAGVDRVLMTTLADSTGAFVFCPVPAGSYDLVAVGVDNTGIAYSAGVLLGISPGQTAGTILLVPSTQQATIQGQVTSQNGSSAATSTDVVLSALQQAGSSGPLVTVPVIAAGQVSTGLVTTASGSSCPGNTDCVTYSLKVPGVYPNVGTWSASGATYTQSTATPTGYTVDAFAFIPAPGGAQNCSPNEQKTTTSVTPGSATAASVLAFTGCQ